MADTDGDSRYWLPPVKDGKPEVLTGHRKQRGDVVAVEGTSGGREYRSLDAPLEFYVARQVITGRQYRAGKRLHTLWAKANPSLYVQARYEDSDGGAKALSFAPHGFGAVEYREALQAIFSQDARRVAFAVCCEGTPASHCVKAGSVRSAKRQGIALLHEALEALADHFKYD
ncbi:hypothetical protein J8F10_08980 [Gemmata sp. G18]|uniref:Uncharacterized protein n=1 Tax=Gemmata palustris TaxID=2822762 RepID=A0ABS5BNW1_9BACT|nr:hypothetical protein [Gemmata palustris]MBP3955413.1 hypothetical protein [Gemmata palustris]